MTVLKKILAIVSSDNPLTPIGGKIVCPAGKQLTISGIVIAYNDYQPTVVDPAMPELWVEKEDADTFTTETVGYDAWQSNSYARILSQTPVEVNTALYLVIGVTLSPGEKLCIDYTNADVIQDQRTFSCTVFGAVGDYDPLLDAPILTEVAPVITG